MMLIIINLVDNSCFVYAQNNTSGVSVSGRVFQRDTNIQLLYLSMHPVKLLSLVEHKWTTI
jgi:hypothetical protein